MALEFGVQFYHDPQSGELKRIFVEILDTEHFDSIAVKVTKQHNTFSGNPVILCGREVRCGHWNTAEIGYSAGMNKLEPSVADCARAKADALVRAAEIAEELDLLWPEG